MADMVMEAGGPCAAELVVMDEFLEALQAGNAPEVEAFLKQHPLYAESLRPVLEGAVLLDREVRKLRRWHVPIDGLGKE